MNKLVVYRIDGSPLTETKLKFTRMEQEVTLEEVVGQGGPLMFWCVGGWVNQLKFCYMCNQMVESGGPINNANLVVYPNILMEESVFGLRFPFGWSEICHFSDVWCLAWERDLVVNPHQSLGMCDPIAEGLRLILPGGTSLTPLDRTLLVSAAKPGARVASTIVDVFLELGDTESHLWLVKHRLREFMSAGVLTSNATQNSERMKGYQGIGLSLLGQRALEGKCDQLPPVELFGKHYPYKAT